MRQSCRFSAASLLLATLVSSCAINQPSPDAGQRVVSRLSVAEARQDESFPLVEQLDVLQGDSLENGSPTAAEDAETTGDAQDRELMSEPAIPLVRWGGTIARVENRADGSTVVELVSRPLLTGGRPYHDDRSEGRFLALMNAFLDPQIVSPGRDMTVLGHVVARAEGTVGATPYTFPVVMVTDFRYWKELAPVPPAHFPHWNTRYPYYFYDPLWRDWPFMPPPRR